MIERQVEYILLCGDKIQHQYHIDRRTRSNTGDTFYRLSVLGIRYLGKGRLFDALGTR